MWKLFFLKNLKVMKSKFKSYYYILKTFLQLKNSHKNFKGHQLIGLVKIWKYKNIIFIKNF